MAYRIKTRFPLQSTEATDNLLKLKDIMIRKRVYYHWFTIAHEELFVYILLTVTVNTCLDRRGPEFEDFCVTGGHLG